MKLRIRRLVEEVDAASEDAEEASGAADEHDAEATRAGRGIN